MSGGYVPFLRAGAAAIELGPPDFYKEGRLVDLHCCVPAWDANGPTQFGRLAAAAGARHFCVPGEDVLSVAERANVSSVMFLPRFGVRYPLLLRVLESALNLTALLS